MDEDAAKYPFVSRMDAEAPPPVAAARLHAQHATGPSQARAGAHGGAAARGGRACAAEVLPVGGEAAGDGGGVGGGGQVSRGAGCIFWFVCGTHKQ